MKISRLCWICNINIADTAEHALKKTDIVRAYGKGSYHNLGENQPIHFKKWKANQTSGCKL